MQGTAPRGNMEAGVVVCVQMKANKAPLSSAALTNTSLRMTLVAPVESTLGTQKNKQTQKYWKQVGFFLFVSLLLLLEGNVMFKCFGMFLPNSLDAA